MFILLPLDKDRPLQRIIVPTEGPRSSSCLSVSFLRSCLTPVLHSAPEPEGCRWRRLRKETDDRSGGKEVRW